MTENNKAIDPGYEQVAFKMRLNKGCKEEYKKRHEIIWPDLEELLKSSGITDYSIFFDEDTHSLFAQMKVSNAAAMKDLPNHPVMKKWWAYMKDIMETNDDNSPVTVPLQQVFYLP